MIKLYTIDCPKCKVIEKKLVNANIDFIIVKDRDEIKAKGMDLMPVLEVDDVRMNFKQACDWVNERS